jgi:hypothetical protein
MTSDCRVRRPLKRFEHKRLLLGNGQHLEDLARPGFDQAQDAATAVTV